MSIEMDKGYSPTVFSRRERGLSGYPIGLKVGTANEPLGGGGGTALVTLVEAKQMRDDLNRIIQEIEDDGYVQVRLFQANTRRGTSLSLSTYTYKDPSRSLQLGTP
jgi:hypothetical protein